MSILTPWQDVGARWLAGRRRALLADGMRVGKTGAAIVAADMVGARSILAVVPGIARENWAREFDRFSIVGRPVSVIMNAGDPIEPNGVTILSMDGSRNAEIHGRIMRHDWDVMICDEAHYLKEPTSQRARLVLSNIGFAQVARRIWFLTGTPLLNHPGELWIILVTIGAFRGSYEDFLNRFCVWFRGDYGQPVVKALRNVAELKDMLRRVSLRRLWHEVSPDTPRPVWKTSDLDPALVDPDAMREFLRIETEERPRVEQLARRILAGETVNSSSFVALRSATALAKAKPLAQWLRRGLEAGRSDKLVVFAHHTAVIETLVDDLAEFGATAIQGSVPQKQRQARIDRFGADPAARVLICQDQIARTAIDLCAARDLVFGEMDLVPENNAQCAMRVQGPRQTRPVRVFTPFLPNSSDSLLGPILVRKSRMAEEVWS